MSAASAERNALSPETFAVLACAQSVVDPRRRRRFREAVAECRSADRLCEAAVRHGMVGHLYTMIGADGDARYAAFVRDPLAILYRATAERALRQTAQLLRLLDGLKAHGIEAMPIKGPAWAERLYGDVTLRTWVDLDLIVSYGQARAARTALLALGFSDSSGHHERLLRRETRAAGELPFAFPDNETLIDLHWQLSAGYGARGLAGADLIARAGTLGVMGRDVLTPSSTDALLVHCVQGTRDRWNSAEALLALACEVRALPDDAWPAVMDAASGEGCSRRMAVGVAHACHLMGLAVPDAVGRRLASDRVAPVLRRSLGPGTLERSPGAETEPRLSKMAWAVLSEDGSSAGFAHALARALRPGPEDWENVALPPSLDWLYYPLRPVRLALKWSKRPPGRRSR